MITTTIDLLEELVANVGEWPGGTVVGGASLLLQITSNSYFIVITTYKSHPVLAYILKKTFIFPSAVAYTFSRKIYGVSQ